MCSLYYKESFKENSHSKWQKVYFTTFKFNFFFKVYLIAVKCAWVFVSPSDTIDIYKNSDLFQIYSAAAISIAGEGPSYLDWYLGFWVLYNTSNSFIYLQVKTFSFTCTAKFGQNMEINYQPSIYFNVTSYTICWNKHIFATNAYHH